MKKQFLLTFLLFFTFTISIFSQTTLTLRNNTTKTVYAAYCIFEGGSDGWVTHGWYKVDSYDERDIDLDDYDGVVYIHGHDSDGKYWGSDVTLCTGGSSGFQVLNADKIRCEYSKRFTKTSISKGGTKKHTFNP